MSTFIEHSKDPMGTSAITDHFAGKNQGQKPGSDPLLRRVPGGTQAWNSSPGDVTFNVPGQNLPMGTGVNQITPDQAGHRTAQDPFALADGFPGD